VVGWFSEGLDTPLLVGARTLLDELGDNDHGSGSV
jgi:hypothetical protein